MKAIRVHEFGGPEVLKLEEVTTPIPSAGEVLVRIHAAGVNPYDTYMRAGAYAAKPTLPYTPGSDGAGVVEAVGEDVKKMKRGDRVYTGRTLTGADAEYALALEEQVHPLPPNIDFKQGAGIWYPTEQHIMRCITRRKRTLLKPYWCMAQVVGGHRGVADRARHGFEGSRHSWNAERGRNSKAGGGASRKSGYQDEILQATGTRGVDIILEMLANVNLSNDTKQLANNGQVIVIGSRGEVTINPRELMGRRASIRAFTLWALHRRKRRTSTPGSLQALKTAVCGPLLVRNCHSPR